MGVPGSSGKHAVMTHTQLPQFGFVQWTNDGSGDPVASSIIDPGGIVTSIERTGTGVYLVQFNIRWTYIQPCGAPNVTGTDTKAKVSTIVQGGSADNSLEVTLISGTSASSIASAVVSMAFCGARRAQT